MNIEPGGRGKMEIPQGVKTTVNWNIPYKFIIETQSGTIIEGTTVPNAPLTVTICEDVTRFDVKVDEGSFTPIHLVK